MVFIINNKNQVRFLKASLDEGIKFIKEKNWNPSVLVSPSGCAGERDLRDIWQVLDFDPDSIWALVDRYKDTSPYFIALLAGVILPKEQYFYIPLSVIEMLLSFSPYHIPQQPHTAEEFDAIERKEIGGSSESGFETDYYSFRKFGTDISVEMQTNNNYGKRLGRSKWILRLSWTSGDNKKYESILTPWCFHTREV